MSRHAAPSKLVRAPVVGNEHHEEDYEFKHTLTTVAQAGVHKPAGAVKSIFEAGQKAKPPKAPRRYAPPMRLEDLVIESGVPVPPAKLKRKDGTGARNVLQAMKPGDRVLVDERQARNLRVQGKKEGIPVVVRQQGNGQAYVWRLAPEGPGQ